jgi:hypothetical protein
MVDRRLLTPEFINRTRAPARGERWVADTKVRGFGLRLWRREGVSGKAYCLRCADAKGRAVRRTFKRRRGKRGGLGAWLEEARTWARDERDHLKDRLTIAQESYLNRLRSEEAFSRLTFRELAIAKLRGMEVCGRTSDYVTRCDKLFSQCVPRRLQDRRLASVKPEDIAGCLKKLDAKPGKARVLRAFIGQILKSSQEFHRGAWRLLEGAQELYSPDYDGRRLYDVPDVPARKLEKLFRRLSEERTEVLQALYIRLLFEFDVPCEALLRARWEHFERSRWYPWLSDPRDRRRSRSRRVEAWTLPVLLRLSDHASRKSGTSSFLFPSMLSRTGHMRTFQNYWSRIAAELSMKKYPLKKWVRAYHRNVLYRIHLEEIAVRLTIGAELSNEPDPRKISPRFVWIC